MADADDPGLRLRTEQLPHRLGQHGDSAGRSLLDQDVAAFPVLESEEHQVHRLLQRHDEPGHLRFRDGEGLARLYLVDPQGHHAAPGAEDVSVAGAADLGALRADGAALGHDDLFHHGLGGSHGVDGVGRLIGGKADDGLHLRVDGGCEDVVRADDVGLHRFQGEELAGGHLLEGRGVEDIVHPVHSVADAGQIPHVADEEAELVRCFRHGGLEGVAHVILLLLISGEDADLPDAGLQKPFQHGVAEGAGPAGDH